MGDEYVPPGTPGPSPRPSPGVPGEGGRPLTLTLSPGYKGEGIRGLSDKINIG
jgi:hypothetical protein